MSPSTQVESRQRSEKPIVLGIAVTRSPEPILGIGTKASAQSYLEGLRPRVERGHGVVVD